MPNVTTLQVGSYPSIRINLKNFGNTPGNVRSAGVFVDIAEDIPPIVSGQASPQYLATEESEAIEVIIGENEIYPRMDAHAWEQWDIRSNTPYTAENIRRIRSGDTHIFCHGWVEYLDIFTNVHEMVFCRRYMMTRNTFVPAWNGIMATKEKTYSARTARLLT